MDNVGAKRIWLSDINVEKDHVCMGPCLTTDKVREYIYIGLNELDSNG